MDYRQLQYTWNLLSDIYFCGLPFTMPGSLLLGFKPPKQRHSHGEDVEATGAWHIARSRPLTCSWGGLDVVGWRLFRIIIIMEYEETCSSTNPNSTTFYCTTVSFGKYLRKRWRDYCALYLIPIQPKVLVPFIMWRGNSFNIWGKIEGVSTNWRYLEVPNIWLLLLVSVWLRPCFPGRFQSKYGMNHGTVWGRPWWCLHCIDLHSICAMAHGQNMVYVVFPSQSWDYMWYMCYMWYMWYISWVSLNHYKSLVTSVCPWTNMDLSIAVYKPALVCPWTNMDLSIAVYKPALEHKPIRYMNNTPIQSCHTGWLMGIPSGGYSNPQIISKVYSNKQGIYT